ncbi:hypothetical protein FRC03_012627, partial [Tulasnella sp. 419]
MSHSSPRDPILPHSPVSDPNYVYVQPDSPSAAAADVAQPCTSQRELSKIYPNFLIFFDAGQRLMSQYFDAGCHIKQTIDNAMICWGAALLTCPLVPDLSSQVHLSLAMCHHQRYLLDRNSKDADAAITHFSLAYLCVPSGNPSELEILKQLTNAFVARHEKEGSVQDFHRAIQCHMILNSREGKLDHPSTIRGFIEAMLDKQVENGGDIDLDSMLLYCGDTLPLCPDNDADRPLLLARLGKLSADRYQGLGRPEDLERAIQCLGNRLEYCSEGDPNYPPNAYYLAWCLLERHKHRGNKDDLDEAIRHIKVSLESHPEGLWVRPHALHHLSTVLEVHCGQESEIEIVQISIQLILGLLSLVDSPDLLEDEVMVEYLLLNRYYHQPSAQYLEESRNLLSTLLQQCPTTHPQRHNLLSILGICHHSLHQHHGGIQELEDAIHCFRESLSLSDHGGLDHLRTLKNLADSLCARYAVVKYPQDLEEATQCAKHVLSKEFHSEILRLDARRTLALCIAATSGRFGPSEIGLEKIEEIEEFLTQYPSDEDLDSLRVIQSVARSINQGDVSQSDLAEELVQIARHHMSIDSPYTPMTPMDKYRLGEALRLRYQVDGDIKDLSEAIQCFSAAVQCSPPDHPQFLACLVDLASTHADYDHLLDPSLRCESITALFKKAVDLQTASAGDRFNACLEWIQKEKSDVLLDAYQKSLELADRFVLVRSSLKSRHDLLSSIPPFLSSDAARSAILRGNLEKAVEFLEQGRSLLWSQMGRYRAPLQKLHDISPDLADEFTKLSQEMEQFASFSSTDGASHQSMEDEARKYRRLSDAWERVVEEIHKLEGFSDFLSAPSYFNLKRAAADGPVILVNINGIHSDAIIVCKSGDPSLVPLSEVGLLDIVRLYNEFTLTIRGPVSRQKLTTILRCLWDDIVGPIVQKLQELGIPHGSRIWWCPTSWLAMLPLHAAGPHRKSCKNLPDLYISSYTSTLSSLIPPHTHKANHYSTSNPPKLLVVAHPEAPKQPPLSWVREEAQRIQQVAPSATVLEGDSGVHRAVIDSLQTHPWVHFTCHGSQNPRQPYESCFHLHDKPLTLLDILQARLPNAQYAFLSACHTARGDSNRPDETIHLAAALQFSGFRSVIGTMYAMADKDGPA